MKQSWDAKDKTELQMRKEFSCKRSEGKRSVEEMMGKYGVAMRKDMCGIENVESNEESRQV